MEIKLRYTWKRKEDGQIYLNIVPIECFEGRGDWPFIGNELWEFIARDLYTGMQDNYKMDIYEGDIIKDKLGRIWKIFWHEHHAGFCYQMIEPEKKHFDGRIGPTVTRCQKYLMEMCEIIGNIYENPELINP